MTQDHRANVLPRSLATWAAMILDLVGSLFLILYVLILGPLWILRGPLAVEGAACYLWVLAPQRLVMRCVRAAIDWRLGHFDRAIAESEAIISACEDDLRHAPESRARRRVLADLYTMLARAYMHAGHIDDAMTVVIRAKKILRVERLPGLAELDAKTAHLVRAGLAAGRLLDGNGLATMFIKTPQTDGQPKSSPARHLSRAGEGHTPTTPCAERPSREVSSASDEETSVATAATLGKVIPFARQPV